MEEVWEAKEPQILVAAKDGISVALYLLSENDDDDDKLLLLFETGSHVAQAGFKLTV